MTRTFFVIAKETCGRCGGDKLIDQHIGEFVDQNRIPMVPIPSPLPKVECPDCRGEGVIVGQVPLEEAINELLDISCQPSAISR